MSSEKLSRRQQELADYRREGLLPSGKLDLTTLNINQVHHLVDFKIEHAVAKVDDGAPVDIYNLSVPACTLLGYFIEHGYGEWVAQKLGDQKINLNNFTVPEDNNRWHLLRDLIVYGEQANWVASHVVVADPSHQRLSMAAEIILDTLSTHRQTQVCKKDTLGV